jgi:hypothetical protein
MPQKLCSSASIQAFQPPMETVQDVVATPLIKRSAVPNAIKSRKIQRQGQISQDPEVTIAQLCSQRNGSKFPRIADFVGCAIRPPPI